MPFTLSHPAAIIPLARRKLILSALVVGSLSPDFLYFINLAPRGQFGHTIPGIFLFCLPMGLLALWIFHALLKWPTLSLLPQAFQERLIEPAQGFTFWPTARLLLIVESLLIGTFTHIVWDGFTHEYGWAVNRLQFLSQQTIEFGHRTIPLFKLLQHSSTAVGGGLLLICIIRWIGRAPLGEVSSELRQPPRYKLFWGVALLIGATVFGLVSSWWRVEHLGDQGGLNKWLACFVTSTLSGLFVELVLFGIYWQFTRHLNLKGEISVSEQETEKKLGEGWVKFCKSGHARTSGTKHLPTQSRLARDQPDHLETPPRQKRFNHR